MISVDSSKNSCVFYLGGQHRTVRESGYRRLQEDTTNNRKKVGEKIREAANKRKQKGRKNNKRPDEGGRIRQEEVGSRRQDLRGRQTKGERRKGKIK